MKVSQALNLKNKLAKEIKDLNVLVNSNNASTKIGDVENPREIDVLATLNEIEVKTNQLVDLKVVLESASMPIRKEIYQLSELKSRISMLNKVNTRAGISNQYGSVTQTTVVIDTNMKRGMIDKLQKQVDTLTNKVNEFNYTTEVSF